MFEKGIKLLKEKGCVSYITSKSYTRAAYGEKLRKLFLKYQIISYVDYTKEKVFEDVSVDTSVILIKKENTEKNIIKVNKSFEMKQNRLTEIPWTFDKEEILNLRDKILSQGELIKNIEDLKINRGVLTGKNKVFIIDKNLKNQLIKEDSKNKEIIKPLIRGRDISQWKINYQDLYIIFSKRNININDYPTIKDYLSEYKEELTPRRDDDPKNIKRRKKGSYKWYELQDAVEFYEDFEKPKIVYSEIVQKPQFAFDNKNYYPEATTFLLTSNNINLKYVLALMNSNVLFWVFRFLCTTLSEKGIRYKKKFIQELPLIIDVSSKTEEKICVHVDNILKYIEEDDEEINIKEEENILNNLIYEIYNITPEEKDIIEKNLF